MRAPHEAKPTAIGLWTKATDAEGRCPLVPELIAAAIYPGEAATEQIILHVLMLEESGFLVRYEHEGEPVLALTRPLKADLRSAGSDIPPPPSRGVPRSSAAMGGARERAEAQVRAEQAEVQQEWAARRERVSKPERPRMLDAPPIGCPDHPDGTFEDCGPCGTARRQHDKFVQETRHIMRMTKWEGRADGPDDEPW